MNVETAKAQLALAEAGEAHVAAKAAYLDDPSEANKKKKQKTAAALLDAREVWRSNFRSAPNGPGDAVAAAEPVSVKAKAN